MGELGSVGGGSGDFFGIGSCDHLVAAFDPSGRRPVRLSGWKPAMLKAAAVL